MFPRRGISSGRTFRPDHRRDEREKWFGSASFWRSARKKNTAHHGPPLRWTIWCGRHVPGHPSIVRRTRGRNYSQASQRTGHRHRSIACAVDDSSGKRSAGGIRTARAGRGERPNPDRPKRRPNTGDSVDNRAAGHQPGLDLPIHARGHIRVTGTAFKAGMSWCDLDRGLPSP